MKKILTTLLTILCCQMALFAQVISEQEAKEKALQFINNRTSAVLHGHRAPARLSQLKRIKLGISGIYAFNREDGGFVIVSADERTRPVLGYSDSGDIDWNQMPANMRAWLTSYAQAISNLGSATMNGSEPTSVPRQAIAPLLKTTWYQDSPYNNNCPKLILGSSMTGCVATAMAQVMKYHRWPEASCEPIPAHSFTYIDKPFPLDALPATTFDWDNMLNDYSGSYTDEQAAAVATLMQYCGLSVKMSYGPAESVTEGHYIADALRLYFGYDNGIYYASRNFYGNDEWEQLIYNELAAGRPVPYTGHAELGGHAFVCDGYDTDGLFHINWGWAGRDDGYFLLSVLNPFDSSCYSGYGIFQEAIIGIQPPTGLTPVADYSPTMIAYGNMALHENAVTFVGFYDNLLTSPATFETAMGTIGQDGKLTPLVMAEKMSQVESGMADTISIVLSKDNLPVGTHQLVPMARCVTTDSPWHLIMAPEKKVVAEVTSDGIQCTLAHLPDLSIKDTYIKKGTKIAMEPNDVALVVNNKGHEYNGNLRLRIMPLGDKTSQEACKELPPVSEMLRNIKMGGYLRAASTEEMIISLSQLGDAGNYLFLLYEDDSEVLLDTVTVAFDKNYEFEFADLEVVSYKLFNNPDDWQFYYEVTLKNNNPNTDWPKYVNKKDFFSVYYYDGELLNQTETHKIDIPHGSEATIKYDGTQTEYNPVTFTLDETLCDGRTKRLLEVTVNIGETLQYPVPTGISTLNGEHVTQSTEVYNLAGQHVKQPTQKGVYIYKGRKKVIK